jgi:hypothetical protein
VSVQEGESLPKEGDCGLGRMRGDTGEGRASVVSVCTVNGVSRVYRRMALSRPVSVRCDTRRDDDEISIVGESAVSDRC